MKITLSRSQGHRKNAAEVDCRNRQERLPVFVMVLGFMVYLLVFLKFFPISGNRMGHDYAYYLPRLLAGYYWFHTNGFFSIPWFTPALGGGLMHFAHPQSFYYSIPQFVGFLVNPLESIRITFVLFSGLGLSGFYFLLHRRFNCDAWSSLLGAVFFLFNGFFTYRMIIGHLDYHSFMLMPFVAFFLLKPESRYSQWGDGLLFCAVAGALFSYTFYSGGIHQLVPAALAVLAICLTYDLNGGEKICFKVRLPLFLLFILLFCASKLNAGFATVHSLPREAYRLPGLSKVQYALWLPFKTLFFGSCDWAAVEHMFTNADWALQQHEFEYSVSFVPLVLVVIGVIRFFRSGHRTRWAGYRSIRLWLHAAAIGILLVIPLLVNFYTVEWNALLKTLPVIKNSSTLLRWYLCYIPGVILFSVLAFEHLNLSPIPKKAVVLAMVVLVVVLNLFKDKSYYREQAYNPQAIISGFIQAKRYREIPKIQYLGTQIRSKYRVIRNDATMIAGVSQIHCYEPIFGYRHEFFPKKDKLIAGPVTMIVGDRYNMKNPACYSFPKANGCKPGDHFKTNQKQALDAFTAYRPFAFEMPRAQKAANILTLVTLLAFMGALLLSGGRAVICRIRNGGRRLT